MAVPLSAWLFMTETKRWKPSLFLCFCFLRSIIASSAICPCTQHSLHPGGTKPPQSWHSVLLSFSSISFSTTCAFFSGVPFFFYKTVLLTFKRCLYSDCLWLSFSLSPSPSHFPKPVGEVWHLSQPFSFCACTLPHPTLFSVCTSLNPGSNGGPGTLTQVPDGQQCLRTMC